MEGLEYVYEPPKTEIVGTNDRKIPNWLNERKSLKGKVIGIFGKSGSGKTVFATSLLYELHIPVVVLLTNDPNPAADLGKHLHVSLIRDFQLEGVNFISKIAQVQRARQKCFTQILNSPTFSILFQRAMDVNEDIAVRLNAMIKNYQQMQKKRIKNVTSVIVRFQIIADLKRELEEMIKQLKIKRVREFVKLHPETLHDLTISGPMEAFLNGLFPGPDLALVLDDFGTALKNCEEMRMLVTFSRKLNLTIIIIAQSPRDVHPSIRDNLGCFIPTTVLSATWCMTHLLHWGSEFTENRDAVMDIFALYNHHAPFILMCQNIVTYISASIWGTFTLGDKIFNEMIHESQWEVEPLDSFLLKLSGLCYVKNDSNT